MYREHSSLRHAVNRRRGILWKPCLGVPPSPRGGKRLLARYRLLGIRQFSSCKSPFRPWPRSSYLMWVMSCLAPCRWLAGMAGRGFKESGVPYRPAPHWMLTSEDDVRGYSTIDRSADHVTTHCMPLPGQFVCMPYGCTRQCLNPWRS